MIRRIDTTVEALSAGVTPELDNSLAWPDRTEPVSVIPASSIALYDAVVEAAMGAAEHAHGGRCDRCEALKAALDAHDPLWWARRHMSPESVAQLERAEKQRAALDAAEAKKG